MMSKTGIHRIDAVNLVVAMWPRAELFALQKFIKFFY